MSLIEKRVNEYLELLNCDDPAPGGGSASALCGAQGAALVSMVAGLTIGKKKYPDDQELCAEVAKAATELKDRLSALVDEDTEAYNGLSAAFKLPKESEEDKANRAKAIALATFNATGVPYKTVNACMEGLELAKKLVGHSNVNAVSDLGVASLNLLAGVKGAWLNVLINLGGISEQYLDGSQVAALKKYGSEGEKIVARAQALSDEIYLAVLNTIKG